MDFPFKLEQRLSLCASFVRKGNIIADIGTDHAYLPVWLCKNKIVPYALACDIKKEPLENGKKTIEKYFCSKFIETRLSDGLENIAENECDDIIIAGMGGEMIVKIIDEWKFSKNISKRFILQPMSRCDELISYLYQNGFEIIFQDCAQEHKKVYTVLCMEYTGKKIDCDNEFFVRGKLKPQDNNLHKQYIEEQIKKLEFRKNSEPQLAEVAKKLREECEQNDNN